MGLVARRGTPVWAKACAKPMTPNRVPGPEQLVLGYEYLKRHLSEGAYVPLCV